MENVHHSSKSVEHYTPKDVVEAARVVMGGFDLDPASCSFANHLIGAARIHTLEDPGHAREWKGRVFLNPPGGKVDEDFRPVLSKCGATGACGLPVGHKHKGVTSSAKAWWFKLVEEYMAFRTTEAIFIGFSIELLQTTQVGATGWTPLSFPFCIPKSRIPFDTESMDGVRRSGGQPTHSNVLVYLPPFCQSGWNVKKAYAFREAFKNIGHTTIPNHRSEELEKIMGP